MNSVTTSSTLHNNQNNLRRSSASVNLFRTSNPTIFPSLNPFSVSPRQKNPNTEEIEEKSKKLVCNDGSHKQIQHLKDSLITKPLMRKFQTEKKSSENSIQPSFAVPKLPKRLSSPVNLQASGFNVPELIKTSHNYQAATDPLLIPENVGYSPKIKEFILRSYILQGEHPAIKKQLVNKNTRNKIVSNQLISPQTLNAVYENLKLEYLSIQVHKKLLQIKQKEHERLAQTLQQILQVNVPLAKNTPKQRERSDSVETAVSIKEEYVKQEALL